MHDGVEVDGALAHEQARPLRLGQAIHVVDEAAYAVRVVLDLRKRGVLVVDKAVPNGLDAGDDADEGAAQLVRHVAGGRPAQFVLMAQRRGEAIHGLAEPGDLPPAARRRGRRFHLTCAHAARHLGEALQRPREVQRDEEREQEGEAGGEQPGLQEQPAHSRLQAAVEAFRGVVDVARPRRGGDDRADLAPVDHDRRALAVGPVRRRRRRAHDRAPLLPEHDDLVAVLCRDGPQRQNRPFGPTADLQVGAGRHLGGVRGREAQVALRELTQLRVDPAVDDHRADRDADDGKQHHGRHEVHANPERTATNHVGSTPRR